MRSGGPDERRFSEKAEVETKQEKKRREEGRTKKEKKTKRNCNLLRPPNKVCWGESYDSWPAKRRNEIVVKCPLFISFCYCYYYCCFHLVPQFTKIYCAPSLVLFPKTFPRKKRLIDRIFQTFIFAKFIISLQLLLNVWHAWTIDAFQIQIWLHFHFKSNYSKINRECSKFLSFVTVVHISNKHCFSLKMQHLLTSANLFIFIILVV